MIYSLTAQVKETTSGLDVDVVRGRQSEDSISRRLTQMRWSLCEASSPALPPVSGSRAARLPQPNTQLYGCG